MGRCQEFIGVRCIEAENVYGEGKHLYNMHLTDTEIIRCRDCEKSRENGWKCTRFDEELYDPIHEIGELVMANVNPDGFCAWAERDA